MDGGLQLYAPDRAGRNGDRRFRYNNRAGEECDSVRVFRESDTPGRLSLAGDIGGIRRCNDGDMACQRVARRCVMIRRLPAIAENIARQSEIRAADRVRIAAFVRFRDRRGLELNWRRTGHGRRQK